MADDTIAAIATAAGAAAISVIRVSGAAAPEIGHRVSGRSLQPRHAQFCTFRDVAGRPIDQGIALYFPAPASYTGEHTVELQGHGGRVVSGLLLKSVLQAGARLARPGEFSERAFLNGKLALPQAEAVADLICSVSEQAARAAVRSLTGNFADAVRQLRSALTELRVLCEAAIDFSEEDLAPLRGAEIMERLRGLHERSATLLAGAQRGRLLNEGLEVLLCGPPNAGKSTLFNALCRAEAAIVSEIPGTTRDLLHAELSMDGLRLRLVDSAGLRPGGDVLEREGMRRARVAAQRADLLIYVVEAEAEWKKIPPEALPGWEALSAADSSAAVIVVQNKTDILGLAPGMEEREGRWYLRLSARTGAGLEYLGQAIQHSADFREGAREGAKLQERGDSEFLARVRHQQALEHAHAALGRNLQSDAALELIAEDLAEAARELGRILGEHTTEELLGEIFSRFCVGK